MAVSSTTDYLDDSLLTELFEDPLISSLIDRSSPTTATSSHLSNNVSSTMNRGHWPGSQDDYFNQCATSSEGPAGGAAHEVDPNLKHLLNAEVMLKTDVFRGKQGTITTISHDGLATVMIDGGIQIRLPYSALQFIAPKPGDKVIVVSGALKGMPGTLLSAEGNDGIFMSQLDHRIWVMKLQTLAKASTFMVSSGHTHSHHYSQHLRTSSTSSMYSHQALSPPSPLTPSTPTSVQSSAVMLGFTPLTTLPPLTTVRSSPPYSSSVVTAANATPTMPMSSHMMYSTSQSSQRMHHHTPPSSSINAHPMLGLPESVIKQTLTSYPSFLKMPTQSMCVKSLVSPSGKADDGYSTKEWLESLLKKPRIKRETSLTDNGKDDIEASVVQISLVCPVSQRRMEYPCRGIHCKHLQCFDAEAYINMNKNWRPKMKVKQVNGTYHSSLAIKADSRLKCPVCNKPTPFDMLYIDKDLLEVIRTTNINEVEWKNGGWSTIQKTSQNGGTDVIDLTLSDSDNE